MSIRSRSRKSRGQNHAPQNGQRLDAAVRFGRPLRMEPLENRWVLAAVSWDGGGDGVNWSDPDNWSANALPNSADDVTINIGGTITHASGNDTILSLTSTQNLTLSGGGITVTTGPSTISGSLNVSNFAALTVNGATATFTANAAATINGANLFAAGGGQLNLATATSYAEQPFNLTTIQASGAGSKIDLSGLASLLGTNGGLNVNALAGGKVEIDSLTSTTARDLNFNVDGATSVLDLSALISASETSLLSSLTLANGGTMIAPVLATYSGGTIAVNNLSATLSSLTNINSSSLFTGAAGILSLPNLTSYTEPPFANAFFQANGAGSRIDLSGLASLTGTDGALSVNALAGGTIEIDSLTSTIARDLSLLADGASSVLNFSALTSASDTTLLSSLTLANGGTLIAPVLATYSGGTIVVNNMSATLSSLTNINSSSLFTGAAGILSLPNLTSYTEPPFANANFQANGAGSKIDLTPLTSLTGTNGALSVNALAGGTIEIDSLTSATARDLNLVADGASSQVKASALNTWSDATNSGNVAVTNSGTVSLSVATATLTGVSVTANSSGIINAGSLILNANSPLNGNGGTVNANVTSNHLTSPGVSPGRVTVTGAYVQGPAASFAVEITGLTVATQYDQLKVNGAVSLGGNLTLSGSYVANVGDTFTIIDNDGVDLVTGTFNNSPEGDIYTFNGRPLRLSYQGGDGNDVTLTRVNNLVVNRRIFYNESAFDGNNAAINTNDDLAIAPDKTPLLPGAGQATIANITNFTRGINGIMVDVSGTGTHTSININDFVFKVGANNSPNLWTGATGPAAISVRPGAGYRGADRVEITWASNAIQNQYLEVQFLPTGNTGIAASDVFFWGHLLGETATSTPAGAFARTVAADRGPILAGGTQANVGITNTFDINKSNSITVAADGGPILAAGTGSLVRISIASGGPFAPEGDAGIASALASTTSPPVATLPTTSLPSGVAHRLEGLDLNSARISAFFQHLAESEDGWQPLGRVARDADLFEVATELDDELLENLVATC